MTIRRVLLTALVAAVATSAAAEERSCTFDVDDTTFDLTLDAREVEGVPSVERLTLSMFRIVGQSAHECALAYRGPAVTWNAPQPVAVDGDETNTVLVGVAPGAEAGDVDVTVEGTCGTFALPARITLPGGTEATCTVPE